MDFRRLLLLRELADRRTVGATADALGITPSAVSQQLKLLQEELGIVLLERQGRGVRLTEAGEAMAAAAAGVAVAMARAEATADGYRRGEQAIVTAAFFPSSAEMLLPGLLDRVAEREGLRLDARLEDPNVQGFIDLAADVDVVVAHSVNGPAEFARPGLVVELLLEEPLDVALPAAHPLAAKAALEPSDVASYPWIGVPSGFPFDTVLRQVELQAGHVIERTQLMPDLRAMEALVRGGHGLSLLPRFTARGALASGLVLRPLTGVHAGRSIVLLARAEVAARPTVRSVMDMVHAEARRVLHDDLLRG
ncbi:LysR family transcriptional regulator [Sinomonas sp. ASV486]|uniref:LysR family transcriptional regulator n=1 Tax=Sinomonas puerhi TaxID=3238584 RepID=A0AB39KYV1_9MICC|nr:LysR family transcriptional regulator [Sinomonas sp. ASV486]MDQ4490636.1 LysR family transcriptional regulator [Sinomonas sp. ASV486]